MTSLTIEFRGVTEQVIEKLIEKGYAKTKSEALRYAILHTAEELGLMEKTFHQKAEGYMEEEIEKRFAKLKR